MVDTPIHVVFAGGGTAGHLFPGLAVAERLSRLSSTTRITFAGTGKEFERQCVDEAGFNYLALPCGPMSYRPKDAIAFVVRNMAGRMAAKRFVCEELVSVVVGLGGYASVPMGLAAKSRKLPLVLLEQNAVPGKATRWLARWADVVCSSFEQAESKIRSRCPVRVTGNPIRAGFDRQLGKFGVPLFEYGTPRHDISDLAKPMSVARAPRRRLMVLGGSGGAHQLNEVVPRALYKVKSRLAGWEIVHQSGKAEFEATRQIYCKLGVMARVVPFIDDMSKMLDVAELAISRAGGTTLAELAVTGVPSLLLPYPHATDNHQRKNADHFATGGGCLIFDERDMDCRLDNMLAKAIAELLGDGGKRARMSLAMRRQAFPKAALEVAAIVRDLVQNQRHRLPMAA